MLNDQYFDLHVCSFVVLTRASFNAFLFLFPTSFHAQMSFFPQCNRAVAVTSRPHAKVVESVCQKADRPTRFIQLQIAGLLRRVKTQEPCQHMQRGLKLKQASAPFRFFVSAVAQLQRQLQSLEQWSSTLVLWAHLTAAFQSNQLMLP